MGILNHEAKVIRIKELEKHPNADNLSLVRIDGYQVVVRTEEFNVGDLAVYIQPDSVVPDTEQFAWLWEGKARLADGSVPLKYRRVTARQFRKEWSEGLLVKVKLFYTSNGGGYVNSSIGKVKVVFESDDVAEIMGITHYEPPEPVQSGGAAKDKVFRWPSTGRGWWYLLRSLLGFKNPHSVAYSEKAPTSYIRPYYDIEGFKNRPDEFQPGEMVVVTEKIHGANMLATFENDRMYVRSREVWWKPEANNKFRQVLAQNPWIEEWCRAHEGFTLWGELTPMQNGAVKMFVFDVFTPEGEFLEWHSGIFNDETIGNIAPVLYVGGFDLERIKKLVDGPSTVPGASHMREGVVIRSMENYGHVRGLPLGGRKQLKIVSNKFLVKSQDEEAL